MNTIIIFLNNVKIYRLIFKFVLILSIFLLISFNTTAQYKLKTVVIDAGHGGKDPGAVSGKLYEKDITLSIALKVGNYIKENVPGVNVIYTRDDDTFVELFRRSEIANENKADLFISIHVNANTSTKAYGTSTYVMGLHKAQDNLELARLENKAILKEDNYKKTYKGYDPNSPETEIILNLMQNAYFDNSVKFASKVQSQFEKRASRKNGGVRQAGLIVLWNCTMPSVLIETGFITNKTEAAFLKSENGQSLIASAIYRAFKEYKKELESKTSSNKTNENPKSETNSEKQENKTEKKEDVVSENEKSNIIYKVQIASSKKQLELFAYNFKGIKGVEYYKSGADFKYTAGNEKTFSEIKKLHEEIKKKYPDSFVIALKNGKIIPVEEAKKVTEK